MLRNPFYVMAGFYLLLDALAVAAMVLIMVGMLSPVSGLDWARIHLLTIGVVVQMILGTLPTLVAAKLERKRPGSKMTWTLWVLLNASFGVLLYSMPIGFSTLAAGAAVGVFAAIVLMLATFHQQGACPPTGARAGLRFYLAGPLFFLIGIVMAMSMLLHWSAPGKFFGILEAHVHANVWGFLALVVAGFLLDHLPGYVGRPLRWPRLTSATFWLLTVGAAGLVAGPWLAVLPLTLLGLVVYVVGAGLLVANLAGTVFSAHTWTPNLAHLVVAYVWMVVPAFVAPTLLALAGHLPTGRVEMAAVSGLVAGWILQMVIGAFPLRLRELQPRVAGRDGWWFSVIALNTGVLGVWVAAFTAPPTAILVLTVAGYSCIVLGWLPPLAMILKRLFGVWLRKRRAVAL